MKLQAPPAPNLPLATIQYDRQYQDQLNNVLRLYFNRLSGLIETVVGNEGGQYLSFPYGTFFDTTTQTAAATSTAYAVKLNTTDLSNSVVVENDLSGNPTKLVVDESGIYNFAFSLQLVKSSASTGDAWIWYRVNGVDVANSATKVTLSGSSAAAVAAWNFFADLNAGDYFQLMWAVDSTTIQIIYQGATAFCPAIPSVIMTVNFISVPPDNQSA